MKPKDVKPGMRLHVNGGLEGKIRHIPVVVADVQPSNCEDGVLVQTDPAVGSGNGISAHWLIEVGCR